jgi:heme oxygenase (biliverdin-IX-beta and delta-forming)
MPDGLASSIRTIHQCLRESTRADHVRLESTLKLLDPELTRERYRLVLGAFLGFYSPLEAQFRRFRRSTALPLGFSLPRRAALLRADLELLGCPPSAIDDEPLREIQSIAEFAGRLYVVEGAALGGQMLARSLGGRWQLQRNSGLAFFTGSGAHETGRRWACVLEWLENVAQSGAKARDMVAAASATFRSLERRVVARLGRS